MDVWTIWSWRVVDRNEVMWVGVENILNLCGAISPESLWQTVRQKHSTFKCNQYFSTRDL